MKKILMMFLLAVASLNANANLIANGDFEISRIPTGTYIYPHRIYGTYESWYYGPNAGVINADGASPWYGATPVTGFSGSQYAFLQRLGSITSTFETSAGDILSLSWMDAARPISFGGCCAGFQTYGVLIDNVQIGEYRTFSGWNFFQEQSISNIILDAGIHTLTFAGRVNDDQTAFIDLVNLSVTGHLPPSPVIEVPPPSTDVPEPASLALFGLGLFGLAAMRRRKNS